jgi:thiamine-phosphate pyrophosphorylase
MTIPQPAICVVTRGRGSTDSSERVALLDRLERAAAAGATIIQIRERQFDDRELVRFAQQVVDAVRPHGTLVSVNERIDIALTAAAGGVHLKSDSPSVADVRRIVPARFVVGRSIHSPEEAIAVQRDGGCDYLFFGTVFPSSSKPAEHPAAGIEALERVCRAVALPVIAIGGISRERTRAVTASGAAGVAAISLFAESSDIASTVREVRDALTLPNGNV